MKIHKNKYRQGYYTKLCDSTLYQYVKVVHFWKHVNCKKCLALKRKTK